jgi:hypothetical protein
VSARPLGSAASGGSSPWRDESESEGAERRPRRWLRPSALAWLVAIALVLWLRGPALDVGYFQDDAVQIAMLDGDHPGRPRDPLDLFRFADMERDGRAALDAGTLPWWSAPDLRIAMFRPLSSALIAADHAAFGAHAKAAHLHSLVWALAAVVAYALALREILPASIVSLAMIGYAIDEAHVVPAAWLANRSYLVAQTFGWLGVLAHLRARRRGGFGARLLETGCFSLALAAGEYAFAMLAYPVALEIVEGVPRTRGRRIAWLPVLAPALAYVALRAVFECGTRSSGLYHDPLAAPFEYAASALERAGTLASLMILGGGVRRIVGTGSAAAWIASGALAGALLIAAATWAGRLLAPAARRSAIGLALGSLLAIAPITSALPDQRLLGAAAGGAAAIAAATLAAAVGRARDAHRAGRSLDALVFGALAAWVVAVHGVEATVASRTTLDTFERQARAEWRWAQSAEIPEDANARVMFLAGADFTTNASLVAVRRLGGHVAPRSCWRLSPYAAPHLLTRVADDVLDLKVGQALTTPMAESLYRAPAEPLATGDRIALDGMEVTVLAAAQGEPSHLRIRFDRSLDDASFVLLHATPRGLVRVSIPPVGGRIRLSPPATPPQTDDALTRLP